MCRPGRHFFSSVRQVADPAREFRRPLVALTPSRRAIVVSFSRPYAPSRPPEERRDRPQVGRRNPIECPHERARSDLAQRPHDPRADQRRAPRRGLKLERIALDSEGNFWHEDELLDDPRICELFHRSIKRTAAVALLEVPPFSYPLVVADVPHWVTQVRFAGEAAGEPTRIRLRLSDGSEEDLAIDTWPISRAGALPAWSKGAACRPASAAPCYFALAEHVVEEEDDDAESYGHDESEDDERYDGPRAAGSAWCWVTRATRFACSKRTAAAARQKLLPSEARDTAVDMLAKFLTPQAGGTTGPARDTSPQARRPRAWRR